MELEKAVLAIGIMIYSLWPDAVHVRLKVRRPVRHLLIQFDVESDHPLETVLELIGR